MPLENNTGALDLIAEKIGSRIAGNNTGGSSSIESVVVQIGNDTLTKIFISELKKIQRQTGQAVIKI